MDINNMSANEIEALEKYIEFKNEAKELYNTVIKNQKISLLPDFKGRHIVWDDTNNQEYLKQENGKWWWVAAYLHQHYEVPIDIEGIFQMMKFGYEWSINSEKRGYVNTNQDAIGYFRSYVRKLKTSK